MPIKTSTGPEWRAFINWHTEAVLLRAVSTDRHPYLSHNGWFVILSATVPEDTHIAPEESLEIVYIGDAFAVSLREKLSRPGSLRTRIEAATPRGKRLIVLLGRATNRSRKRRTTDYLDGVLRALRKRHKPLVTDARSNGPYRGKTVSVVNEGDFFPLKPKVLLRPDASESARSDTQGAAVATENDELATSRRTVVRRKNSGRIRESGGAAANRQPSGASVSGGTDYA